MNENKSIDELILRVVEAEIELEKFTEENDKDGIKRSLKEVMLNCRRLRQFYLKENGKNEMGT